MLICRGLQRNFWGAQSFNYVTAARYRFYSNRQHFVSSMHEMKEQFKIQFQRGAAT